MYPQACIPIQVHSRIISSTMKSWPVIILMIVIFPFLPSSFFLVFLVSKKFQERHHPSFYVFIGPIFFFFYFYIIKLKGWVSQQSEKQQKTSLKRKREFWKTAVLILVIFWPKVLPWLYYLSIWVLPTWPVKCWEMSCI